MTKSHAEIKLFQDPQLMEPLKGVKEFHLRTAWCPDITPLTSTHHTGHPLA